MTDYTDLGISLDPVETGQFSIKLRLSLSGSDTPVELTGDEPAIAQFDINPLGGFSDSPAKYSQSLSDRFLVAEKARVFFEQARSMAASHSEILRIRLKISCTASKLHQLRWEILR